MIISLGECNCYSPDEIASPFRTDIVIKRFNVVRKPAELSNTELISKIMKDVRESNLIINNAMPYYRELRKRMPDTQFTKGINEYFDRD